MKITIMFLADELEKTHIHIPQCDVECEMNMSIIQLISPIETTFSTAIM
jgi:hypothetical protein